jgi:hypothetical protein
MMTLPGVAADPSRWQVAMRREAPTSESRFG